MKKKKQRKTPNGFNESISNFLKMAPKIDDLVEKKDSQDNIKIVNPIYPPYVMDGPHFTPPINVVVNEQITPNE